MTIIVHHFNRETDSSKNAVSENGNIPRSPLRCCTLAPLEAAIQQLELRQAPRRAMPGGIARLSGGGSDAVRRSILSDAPVNKGPGTICMPCGSPQECIVSHASADAHGLTHWPRASGVYLHVVSECVPYPNHRLTLVRCSLVVLLFSLCACQRSDYNDPRDSDSDLRWLDVS